MHEGIDLNEVIKSVFYQYEKDASKTDYKNFEKFFYSLYKIIKINKDKNEMNLASVWDALNRSDSSNKKKHNNASKWDVVLNSDDYV